MPGFPRAEQRFLAYLIDSQRHQLSIRLQSQLPSAWREMAFRLAILLRLAVLLNRSRSVVAAPSIKLSVRDDSLDLRFDRAWLQSNPLTVADLEREQEYLKSVGYDLSFS